MLLMTSFPKKVAKYSLNDINRLMVAPGIIHNKMKIQAAINNASRF
jgi:3-methyladenine DNA glycosylase Tag